MEKAHQTVASRLPAERTGSASGEPWFATTHWSVVLAAGHPTAPGAQAAIETLCRAYWFPLYSFVRQQGRSPEEAQDLTQAYFARVLERGLFSQAKPERGRFRTFLLTAFKHFLVNEWKRETRQKRGGGQLLESWDAPGAEARYRAEPIDTVTPEILYERHWAATLLDRVMARLRGEYIATGRSRMYDQLKGYVWGEQSATPYATVAVEFHLTESAIKMAVHRLRQRCGELLRAEIACTVARPEDVDDELRHLIAVLSG